MQSMCLPPTFTGTLVWLVGTDKTLALVFGHRLPFVALPSFFCWHSFCRLGTELSLWIPLPTASDDVVEAEEWAKLTALDILEVLADLACFLDFSVLAACRDDILVGLTRVSLFVLTERLEPLTLAFEDMLDFPAIESCYTSESLLTAKFLTKNNYTHTGKKKSSLQHLNLCSNYSSLRTRTTTENLLPESSSNFVCFRKRPHRIPELLQSSQRIFFKECQNSLQIQVAFSAFSPSIVGSVPLSKYSRR